MRSENRVDPRSERKGESAIVKQELRIEDVIARRRERAVVRSGYAALLVRVAVLALIVYLVLTYAFLITQNSGLSMFPAMKDGDLCVVFRRPLQELLGEKISAGDIVAYQVDGKRAFGRVVAVAGDQVQIDSTGTLTVNGAQESQEILFPTYTRGDLLNITNVTSGQLFILGDYRTQATDSRDHGPIPLTDVEGKVITILRRRGL